MRRKTPFFGSSADGEDPVIANLDQLTVHMFPAQYIAFELLCRDERITRRDRRKGHQDMF